MQKLYDGTPYELMPELLRTPQAEAISYAVSESLKKILDYAKQTALYADIEEVSDEVLDAMAAELRTQYYDPKASRKECEEMVKKTVGWYMVGGTGAVLEEYLATLYSGGKVTEWYEYGGKPYYFKAIVLIPEETLIPVGDSAEIIQRINRYKNVRSWLEALEFHFLFEYLVKIQYEAAVRLHMEFYPRMNMKPILLDGTWKLDGKFRLNGYQTEIPADLYPVHLQFPMDVGFEGTVESGMEFTAFAPEKLEYGMKMKLDTEVEEMAAYRTIIAMFPIEASLGAVMEVSSAKLMASVMEKTDYKESVELDTEARETVAHSVMIEIFPMEARIGIATENNRVQFTTSALEKMEYDARVEFETKVEEKAEHSTKMAIRVSNTEEVMADAELYIGQKLNGSWKLNGKSKLIVERIRL